MGYGRPKCKTSSPTLGVFQQAYSFGWGAPSESWRKEWGEEKPRSLAGFVVGFDRDTLPQTSEPARKLWKIPV